ncbi:hypothetical protein EW146_g7154 [Bondarzewia mesenterica]|uniref:Ubiquitin-like protease family profile domain-containing protein n=1 Tax=Bondarzewia mesenterica TaxID=1095465 RepID=A0A4S4LLQ9_9AGAM|nr:hypothetical protein EW146_g7154 [Bondarzewia mesenterica]
MPFQLATLRLHFRSLRARRWQVTLSVLDADSGYLDKLGKAHLTLFRVKFVTASARSALTTIAVSLPVSRGNPSHFFQILVSPSPPPIVKMLYIVTEATLYQDMQHAPSTEMPADMREALGLPSLQTNSDAQVASPPTCDSESTNTSSAKKRAQDTTSTKGQQTSKRLKISSSRRDSRPANLAASSLVRHHSLHAIAASRSTSKCLKTSSPGHDSRPTNLASPTQRAAPRLLDPNPTQLSIDDIPPGFRYPFHSTGGVHIGAGELSRLEPDRRLNDNLIECALKLWYNDLNALDPILAMQIHVFSPFFFKKISEGYNSVKRYTMKVDVFTKRMLEKPSNTCGTVYSLQSAQPVGWTLDSGASSKQFEDGTKILIFDSLGRSCCTPKKTSTYVDWQTSKDPARRLCYWLWTEALTTQKRELLFPPAHIQVKVPRQRVGSVDCGVHVIHLVCIFVAHASMLMMKIWTRANDNLSATNLDTLWQAVCVPRERQTLKNHILDLMDDWRRTQGTPSSAYIHSNPLSSGEIFPSPSHSTTGATHDASTPPQNAIFSERDKIQSVAWPVVNSWPQVPSDLTHSWDQTSPWISDATPVMAVPQLKKKPKKAKKNTKQRPLGEFVYLFENVDEVMEDLKKDMWHVDEKLRKWEKKGVLEKLGNQKVREDVKDYFTEAVERIKGTRVGVIIAGRSAPWEQLDALKKAGYDFDADSEEEYLD